MKLPDFEWYSSFEQLVQSIGATETVEIGELGWAELAGRGIDIDDLDDIQIHDDNTLTFRGYRVLVYIRDQYLRKDGSPTRYRYHVSDCKTLKDMREKKRFGRYVATNRKDGLFMVNYLELGINEPIEEGVQEELKVCKNCLDALDWNHFKDESFTQKRVIWRSFSPATFFETYQTKISVLPSYNEFDAPINQYAEGWDELSRHAKASRNWTCEKCEIDLTADRKFLHTHHKDGNKANNLRSNMEVLCIGCHAEQPDHQHLKNLPHYTEFLRQKPLLRRARSSPNTSKKYTPTKASLDQVLSMTNRKLGRVICAILEECPNYASKKDDLTKHMCQHFELITRGAPREQLKKKIEWAVTRLKKDGKVEEYKAKNIRIRLLNPSEQGDTPSDPVAAEVHEVTEGSKKLSLDRGPYPYKCSKCGVEMWSLTEIVEYYGTPYCKKCDPLQPKSVRMRPSSKRSRRRRKRYA